MHNEWTDAAIRQVWQSNPPYDNAVNELRMRWGDSTAVLVGEWGLSEEEIASHPNGIQHMHGALGSRADSALFFQHPRQRQAPNTWGLHWWDNAGPELVVTDEMTTHVPYKSAVGP